MLNLTPTDDMVTLDGTQPSTTSIAVAKAFGKQHFHVLREIRNLGCSAEFNASNFGCIEVVDSRGRPKPAYTMTRDGFVLLAMGFTGEKAMQWKEKFLDAFNQMERELRRREEAKYAGRDIELLRTQRRLIQAQRALLTLHRRELRRLVPRAVAAVPDGQMALAI